MANNQNSDKNLKHKNRRVRSLPKKKTRTVLKAVLIAFLGIFIVSALTLGVYTAKAIAGTPKWDPKVLGDLEQSSIVYDSEGNQIAQLHGLENRLWVDFEDIPKLVIDTFIAVEDKRFYEHYGADPIRILKAAINNLRAGQPIEGGSTITIQLAKNAFIEDPTAKKLDRKIQELVLALQIERTYTKNEILTFYLNRIFFGESSFGIRTAAQTYFGKELNELNPAEIALLAGLPQAPSAYDPYINPDKAKYRRNIVLGIMRDNGLITQEEYEKYKEEPFTFVEQVKANKAEVKLGENDPLKKKFPYFVDYVIAELQNKYGLTPQQIFNGGLHIYTTVNPKIQTAAENAFAKAENFPKSVDEIPVQGAITVLETKTGAITAMVGGREYTPMGLNRAWQSKRQPGSTAKPLVVYAPAIEKGGYFPGTVFDDMPVEYSDGTGGVWKPENFDTITTGWRGLITMREAIEDSVNVYAVKLLDAIGILTGWEFGKNRLGLPLEEKHKVLSLALGTFEVSTLEMASAYATFGNNGVKTEPYSVTKVVDSAGNTIIEHTPEEKRVMKETTAYLMNDLLRSVVTSGTGTRARIGNWYICGKTGTTSLDPKKYGNRSGNPDAWFAGYSPVYTAVVWMGYDYDEDLKHYLYKVYGSSYPTTIWKEVMTAAHEGLEVQSGINRPKGITTVKFDRKSGLLPSSLTPEEFISTEVCAVDSVPTRVSDIWIQLMVDPENPDRIVPEDTPWAIPRVFLNVEGRPENVPWPKEEQPYKIPDQSQFENEPIDNEEPPENGEPTDDGEPSENDEPSGNDKPSDNGQPGENPPVGDSAIPQLSIGSPDYNKRNVRLRIPILSEYDPKKYTVMLYVRKPGVSYLETFVPKNGNTRFIDYNLSTSENDIIPGSYTFWAALMDNDTFKVGPPSNAIKIQVKLQNED